MVNRGNHGHFPVPMVIRGRRSPTPAWVIRVFYRGRSSERGGVRVGSR